MPGVCVFFCKKIRQVNLGKFFGAAVERDFPRGFPSFPRVWSMIWRHETKRGLNDIPLYGSRCANGWTCIFSKFWNGSIDPTLVVQPTSNSQLFQDTKRWIWWSKRPERSGWNSDFESDFGIEFGKSFDLAGTSNAGICSLPKGPLDWDPLTWKKKSWNSMRGSCNHHFFQCKEMMMCFGWWKFGCQKICFEEMWQRSWIMNFMTSYSWKPGTSSTSSTVWRPRAPRKSDDFEANEHFETPAVECTCFEAIVRLECWKLTWEVRKPLDMDARENYVSFACYFFQCFHWDISRRQTFN